MPTYAFINARAGSTVILASAKTLLSSALAAVTVTVFFTSISFAVSFPSFTSTTLLSLLVHTSFAFAFHGMTDAVSSDEAPGVIVSSVRFNTIESGTVISS